MANNMNGMDFGLQTHQRWDGGKIMQQDKHSRVGVPKRKQDRGTRWLIMTIDVGRRHKYIIKNSLVNLPHIIIRCLDRLHHFSLLSCSLYVSLLTSCLSLLFFILSFKMF